MDFWAEWCAPCSMMTPVLAELAAENNTGLKIGKVNVEEEPELARRYRVRSIPAMKIFSSGEIVAEQIGAIPKDQLQALLQ